jgi:hypothetical protein
MEVSFLLHVSNMDSLEDIMLVPNLATRAWGGTVVYLGWFLGKFQGGFAFYLMSLTCIV